MNYNVIKIVNEYLVVVDYGIKNNAKIGDELEIFQIGEEIYHPKNREFLGTLDIKKAKIKVINVYDNMSLCKSSENITKLSSTAQSFGKTLAALSQSIANTVETKPLLVNTEQITGGYEDKELTINILDPVKVVLSKYDIDNDENEED